MAGRRTFCTFLRLSLKRDVSFSSSSSPPSLSRLPPIYGRFCAVHTPPASYFRRSQEISMLLRFLRSSSFSSFSFADDEKTHEKDALKWEMEPIRKKTQSPSLLSPLPLSSSSPLQSSSSSPQNVLLPEEEYDMENCSEETASSEPAPFGEPTDIYIPVKAFFISRRFVLQTFSTVLYVKDAVLTSFNGTLQLF